METKKSVKPYPADLRERSVRMVREQAREHASGALAFGGAFLVEELFGNHDDHDSGGNGHYGWDDYSTGRQPIDWRDRQFYPRPGLRQRHSQRRGLGSRGSR